MFAGVLSNSDCDISRPASNTVHEAAGHPLPGAFGSISADERDSGELGLDQRIKLAVVGCDHVPDELFRQRQWKAVSQRDFLNFAFQIPNSLPERSAHITA